jgi:hypothetical protein
MPSISNKNIKKKHQKMHLWLFDIPQAHNHTSDHTLSWIKVLVVMQEKDFYRTHLQWKVLQT